MAHFVIGDEAALSDGVKIRLFFSRPVTMESIASVKNPLRRVPSFGGATVSVKTLVYEWNERPKLRPLGCLSLGSSRKPTPPSAGVSPQQKRTVESLCTSDENIPGRPSESWFGKGLPRKWLGFSLPRSRKIPAPRPTIATPHTS
jgi:hypothetical protein